MKNKVHAVVCLLSSLLGFCAGAEAKNEGETRKADVPRVPLLVLDTSPVTEAPKVPVSYADVIEPVQKAVVSVYSSKVVKQKVANPMVRQLLGAEELSQLQAGLGSGVIVSADGYILTNNHVIEGADKLNVQLFDDRELQARVVGSDPKTDIAVIKIEAAGLPCATIADSDKLRVGDVVFALGNPLNVGQTVTMGIISAVGRSNLKLIEDGSGYESFIQTDAAINMGNSGGALVDAKGRLIGINTAILSPSRGSIGIGFSVPVNLATSILNSIILNNGVVHRGMLGIVPDNITAELIDVLGLKKEQKGVFVSSISPEDGPAHKAGLLREDVIVAINGKPINNLQELRMNVAPLAPGSLVKVKVLRSTFAGKEKVVEEKDFDVTLGTLESSAPSVEILKGVKASLLTPELRRQYDIDRRIEGIVIQDVTNDSSYADRLAPGLVIIEVNRRAVTSIPELRAALKTGKANLLYVFYKGGLRYVSLPVP